MLDLRRLRILRELEARGTVHAAARALDYTPSAVSQQLAALEREAGTALLERAGRGVRLTDAGRLLARHARTLLDGVEAAEAELAAGGRGPIAGTVRLAAFQSAALSVAAPAAAAVAARYPAVRIELVEAELQDAVPDLRLGHLDAVVGDEYGGLPRPRHADLRREPLLREELEVVLPEGHPLARRRRVPIAALSDAAWAGAQPGTGHREMHVRTCRRLGGFEPDIRHTSDDFLILLELVRTVGACALLPKLVTARGTPGAVVRPLAEGRVEREVLLLTRATRPPALQAVADALTEAARTALAA
jgi:DNA-binding transcriptional LysR family regulator